MPNELRSEAFLAAAMEDCGDAVYRLALCRLGSRADAEDVYQEVFLRLLRDTTDFSDAEHLKAWLLRVAMQRCTDLRRSAWFQRTAPLEAAPDAAAPNKVYGSSQRAANTVPPAKNPNVTTARKYLKGRFFCTPVLRRSTVINNSCISPNGHNVEQ